MVIHMAPIKEYSNWNKRSSNKEEQMEPYRRYYFILRREKYGTVVF